MKKFRYLIVTQEFDQNMTDGDLYKYFDDNNILYENSDIPLKDLYVMNKINAWGKEGWELVSTIDKKDRVMFYFKKEII